MTATIKKLSLIFSVFTVTLAVLMFVGVVPASAQSDGSFQITSSKDISAIQGESFTYFVVTANNTDYQLQSQLPSGLSFSNGSISGTPQTAGNYQLDFVASNTGETETVNLTVLSSSGGAEVAQTDPGSGQSAAANQGGEGSVPLNEIPDTGLSADQAITLAFYLLALLMVSFWGVSTLMNMLRPATNEQAKADSGDTSAYTTGKNSDGDDSPIGDGVR
jgi:hypothetical protein